MTTPGAASSAPARADLPVTVMLDLSPATAIGVLAAHLNDTGLCAICGCPWPGERVMVAEHNRAVP